MSSVQVNCPKCDAEFHADTDPAQSEIQCPQCGKILTVRGTAKHAPESIPRSDRKAVGPANRDSDSRTYRLSIPDPEPPSEQASASAEAAQETTRPTRPKPNKKKREKDWRQQAAEQRKQMKRTVMFWSAGAGVFAIVCVVGVVLAIRSSKSNGSNVGDFWNVSSGNFVQAEEVPEEKGPVQLGLNRDTWVDAAGAMATGPETDKGAAPWVPMQGRAAPASPPVSRLSRRPLAWNDTHYLAVEFADIPGGPDRGGVWQLYDLKTDREVGGRISFGRGSFPTYRPVDPIMALSPDHRWVVGTDYRDRTQLHVWDIDGNPKGDLAPLEHYKVIGLYFGAGGELLTLNQGTLQAWSLPELKPLWSVKQKRPSFVVPSTHGDWVAMGHERSIDLIDVETGKRRGRLSLGTVEFITDLAISPDETKIVAMYRGGWKNNQTGMLVVWDLQRGTARQIVGGLSRPETYRTDPHLRQLFWIDENWVATQASTLRTFSFKNVEGWSEPSVSIDIPGLTGEQAGEALAFVGPGGKFWARTEGGCLPFEFQVEEDENLAEVQAEAEKQLRSRGPTTTVAVEVDAGSEERSRRIAQAAAAQLRSERIRVVEDGPRLRATFSVSPGPDMLEYGSREISTPRVSVAWAYLDDEGKKRWTEGYGISWKGERSKFKKGFPDHRRNGEIIYRFEFPNNPRQDMFEEVMSNPWKVPDAAIDRLKPPQHVPQLPECPVVIRLVGTTPERELQPE